MTETEAKWAERVRRWRASGKTAPEFAQGQGFESSTLRYWSSRLKHLPQSQAKPVPDVRMLRVRRKPHRAAVESMVIAIGAARIELHAGFDGAMLREVVEALAVVDKS